LVDMPVAPPVGAHSAGAIAEMPKVANARGSRR